MLCDRVLFNLPDPPVALPPAKRAIALDLTWLQCHGRTFRRTFDDGLTVRLIMSPGVVLRHGDVVHDDEGLIVWINQLPCVLFAVQTTGCGTLPQLMYELGNLHAPLEFIDGGFLTLPDGPIEATLQKHGVAFRPEVRRFNPIALPNGESFQLANHFGVTRRKS